MLRKFSLVSTIIFVVTIQAVIQPPSALPGTDLPNLEAQFIAAEPSLAYTGLVDNKIVGTGGWMKIRATLGFKDKVDLNTLHWYCEVATVGPNAAVVWWHRYPDFVVPVNTAAPAAFIQDLMMPAGTYVVQLALMDYVVDGATGGQVERPWAAECVYATVGP